MCEQEKCDFLRKRMIELRKKYGKNKVDMANLIACNKSTLSRAEKIGGKTGYKTIRLYAVAYCDKLGLTPEQKEQFLRGEKIAVVDTSALLSSPQLIDDLCREYYRVIIPDIVVNELDNIKNHNKKGLSKKAWQILRNIDGNKNIITMNYTGNKTGVNNDCKIVDVAEKAAEKNNCRVDLVTRDTGFAARLKGHNTVRALPVEKYIATKQNFEDINILSKINEYYADSYENIESALNIKLPDKDGINAYLTDGNTLIIAVVRNRKKPIEQRKEKLRWLIAHGADVDKRDSGKYYFPPLSHSIQNHDFEIFKFLLHECNANPNIGSRNPSGAGKIMQKNEGNMPLMVAAWGNEKEYVRELLADKRTSINQQDGNGFTALIKAGYRGWRDCMDILIKAGADERIVDRDGYTAEEEYRRFLRNNRKRAGGKRKNNG